MPHTHRPCHITTFGLVLPYGTLPVWVIPIAQFIWFNLILVGLFGSLPHRFTTLLRYALHTHTVWFTLLRFTPFAHILHSPFVTGLRSPLRSHTFTLPPVYSGTHYRLRGGYLFGYCGYYCSGLRWLIPLYRILYATLTGSGYPFYRILTFPTVRSCRSRFTHTRTLHLAVSVHFTLRSLLPYDVPHVAVQLLLFPLRICRTVWFSSLITIVPLLRFTFFTFIITVWFHDLTYIYCAFGSPRLVYMRWLVWLDYGLIPHVHLHFITVYGSPPLRVFATPFTHVTLPPVHPGSFYGQLHYTHVCYDTLRLFTRLFGSQFVTTTTFTYCTHHGLDLHTHLLPLHAYVYHIVQFVYHLYGRLPHGSFVYCSLPLRLVLRFIFPGSPYLPTTLITTFTLRVRSYLHYRVLDSTPRSVITYHYHGLYPTHYHTHYSCCYLQFPVPLTGSHLRSRVCTYICTFYTHLPHYFIYHCHTVRLVVRFPCWDYVVPPTHTTLHVDLLRLVGYVRCSGYLRYPRFGWLVLPSPLPPLYLTFVHLPLPVIYLRFPTFTLLCPTLRLVWRYVHCRLPPRFTLYAAVAGWDGLRCPHCVYVLYFTVGWFLLVGCCCCRFILHLQHSHIYTPAVLPHHTPHIPLPYVITLQFPCLLPWFLPHALVRILYLYIVTCWLFTVVTPVVTYHYHGSLLVDLPHWLLRLYHGLVYFIAVISPFPLLVDVYVGCCYIACHHTYAYCTLPRCPVRCPHTRTTFYCAVIPVVVYHIHHTLYVCYTHGASPVYYLRHLYPLRSRFPTYHTTPFYPTPPVLYPVILHHCTCITLPVHSSPPHTAVYFTPYLPRFVVVGSHYHTFGSVGLFGCLYYHRTFTAFITIGYHLLLLPHTTPTHTCPRYTRWFDFITLMLLPVIYRVITTTTLPVWTFTFIPFDSGSQLLLLLRTQLPFWVLFPGSFQFPIYLPIVVDFSYLDLHSSPPPLLVRCIPTRLHYRTPHIGTTAVYYRYVPYLLPGGSCGSLVLYSYVYTFGSLWFGSPRTLPHHHHHRPSPLPFVPLRVPYVCPLPCITWTYTQLVLIWFRTLRLRFICLLGWFFFVIAVPHFALPFPTHTTHYVLVYLPYSWFPYVLHYYGLPLPTPPLTHLPHTTFLVGFTPTYRTLCHYSSSCCITDHFITF